MKKLLLALALFVPVAEAGIVFTPHLSEYGILPRGTYADHTVIYTSITDVYDRDGIKVPLGTPKLPVTPGAPFIPPGESVDAALMLFRYLWIGNIFENTDVPYLNSHNQIFRVIATAGWQQGSDGVATQSRLFGLRSGGSGIGDLFVLNGIYTDEYRWGPVKGNGLWSVTTKIPVGDYDTTSLLNIGTNYWTTIPQFAMHAELFGRLYFDGTAAYQFNGRNDSPAYGGLTPTDPADLYNFEGNLAWKLSEKWFVDLGYSYRKTVGPNKFEKVTVAFKDPLPPFSGCAAAGIPVDQCTAADQFRLVPVPGTREDRGVQGTLLTTSLYYIYRTSSVINFRVAIPIKGRGSQFNMDYEVDRVDPAGLAPDVRISNCASPTNATCQRTVLNGVQEAAAVSASPFFELRFVYLVWAP